MDAPWLAEPVINCAARPNDFDESTLEHCTTFFMRKMNTAGNTPTCWTYLNNYVGMTKLLV